MKLVVGFYLAWLSTRNSCKWSPCICWFNIFMTWSTSTDHLEIMSTNPSFLPQPMRCIVYKSYRFTRYQFFPFHFSILWPGSTFVWVWGRTGGRGGRPAWLRACARSGRDACERGGAAAGGWWWLLCRHAQTWSSPLSANLGRAELVKHTTARSPAQLPRHAHTHSD